MCGTQGYMAPELLRLLPQRFQARSMDEFTYALDIWSLGCMVHEILTSQTPFLETDSGFSEFDSGFPTLAAAPEVDMARLYEYCHGKSPFPTEVLQNSQVAEEGIEFVKSLLVAVPHKRATAATALEDSWLENTGYHSNWYRALENQCTDLGLGLSLGGKIDRTLLRQFRTRDIARYISAPAAENLTLVLAQALEKGHDELASMLLNSPTRRACDPSGDDFQQLIQQVVGDGLVDWMKVLLSDEQHPNLTFSDGRSMLQLAVQRGQLDMARFLLDRNADVNAKPIDESGRTPLQTAVEGGRIDLVKLLLDNNADSNTNVNGRNVLQIAASGGRTDIAEMLLTSIGSLCSGMGTRAALVAAIDTGSTEMVKLLLNHKVDVNTKENDQTPLKIAVLRGHIVIVKLLLENNADVGAEYDGHTALEIAVENGYTDIVQLLLQNHPTRQNTRRAFLAAVCGSHLEIVKQFLVHEADVDIIHDDRSVLQIAVENSDISMAKLLLKFNANVTAGVNGRTVLHVAVELRHINRVKLPLDHNAHDSPEKRQSELVAAVRCAKVDIVQLLLDNNADVNAKENGRTALQIAVESRDTDILKLLLGGHTHAHTSDNIRTAFLAAARGGDIEIVQHMLDSEANVTAGVNDLAAFRIAMEHGHTDVAKLLLNHYPGVFTELSNEDRNPILRIVVEKEQIDILKLLIGQISDGSRGSATRESLLVAVGGGHFVAVAFLLENNALLPTSTIRTLLELAIMRGYREIVELLVENITDINGRGSEGNRRTLLQVAVESGHIGVVELLLERNADVNIRSLTTGWTPLQVAARSGNTEIVRLLLENKADVNAAPSDTGCTALQGAAQNGNIDLVRLLVWRGADINAKASRTGWTALQGAAKYGHTETFWYLRIHGATVNLLSDTGCITLECAAQSLNLHIMTDLLRSDEYVGPLMLHIGGADGGPLVSNAGVACDDVALHGSLFSDIASKVRKVNLQLDIMTLAVVRLLSDIVFLTDPNAEIWTNSPIDAIIGVSFTRGIASFIWSIAKSNAALTLRTKPIGGTAQARNQSWKQLSLTAGATSAATLWLTRGADNKPEVFEHGVLVPTIAHCLRYFLYRAKLRVKADRMLPTYLLICLRLLTVLKPSNSRPWRAAFFRPIVEAVLHVVLCDGGTQNDAVRHRTLENLIQLVYRIIQLLLAIYTRQTKSSDKRAVDAAVRYGSLDWCPYLYRSARLYFPGRSRLRYAGPFPSFTFVPC